MLVHCFYWVSRWGLNSNLSLNSIRFGCSLERKKKRKEERKRRRESSPSSNTAQPAQPFHAGPALLFPFPGPTQRAARFPPHGPLLSPPFFLSPLRIPGRTRPKCRNAPRSAQQRPGLLLPRGPSRCSTADRALPAPRVSLTRRPHGSDPSPLP